VSQGSIVEGGRFADAAGQEPRALARVRGPDAPHPEGPASRIEGERGGAPTETRKDLSMKRSTRETPTPEGRSPAIAEETVRVPRRRRGGQELPDDVQDRPEQNAGYDAAVRGDTTSDDRDLQLEAAGDDVERVPPAAGTSRDAEIDARAERDAAAEVRRRERRR
jgi:hypothetical protein